MVFFRGFAYNYLAPGVYFGSEAVPLDLDQPLNLPSLAETAAAAVMLSDLRKLMPSYLMRMICFFVAFKPRFDPDLCPGGHGAHAAVGAARAKAKAKAACGTW